MRPSPAAAHAWPCQHKQWNLESVWGGAARPGRTRPGLRLRLEALGRELPRPVAFVPEPVRQAGRALDQDPSVACRNARKALEPVNMLALEETRAAEIRPLRTSRRLDILTRSRKLLLRSKPWHLRRGLPEAFHAVMAISARSSPAFLKAESHLQLENIPSSPSKAASPWWPIPKEGVLALASMSAGKVVLTALSFLFALQALPPVSLLSLDEVDSPFSTREREAPWPPLNSPSQAGEAQFLGGQPPKADDRRRDPATIGVHQPRAHTQVVWPARRRPEPWSQYSTALSFAFNPTRDHAIDLLHPPFR